MATKKEEEKLVAPLAGVSENTAQKLAQYQAGYQQGENVTNAYNEYNTLKQNAPQAYVSPYQTQLDDLYAKITNRGPFKYSLNGDMLYQNAKEQYQQLGKQAMVDTIGQATQLTGGYGNSYAQNVGNQAYQQYLLKLNDRIPEYYNLAMQRYNMEGDELNNQYGLLRDRENEAYGRYRDTVSDYNNNLTMAYNVYNNERDNDYGQYRDALDYWQNQAGAENADYWNQTKFDYQKEQDALDRAMAQDQFAQEMAYRYAALARSGGGGGKKEEKKEEEQPKAKTDNSVTNSLVALARNASSTALGINSKGIGIALSPEAAIKNNAQKVAAEQEKYENPINAKNDKAPALKAATQRLGLNINNKGTTLEMANYISEQLLSKQNSYKSQYDFKNDIADALEYYYKNGLISDGTVNLVLSKFK